MRQRLIVVAVIGGLGALIALGVVVFQYGRYDPSPPLLEDDPDPRIPGEILYQDDDGCLVRISASGEGREEFLCGILEIGPGVTWIDESTVGYLEYLLGAPCLISVEIATGRKGDECLPGEFSSKSVKPYPYPGGGTENSEGEIATVDEDGAVYIVKGGERAKIRDFEVPEYQTPTVASWSPDNQWLLITYYPPRGPRGPELWVLSRDGKVAGTLATDLAIPSASWRIDGVGISPPFQEQGAGSTR